MYWNDGCSTMRVWTVAAQVLTQVHDDYPEVPIDPELFVASQPLNLRGSDVWRDLTSPAAAESYRKRVRGIVRLLERELKREVRRAERLIRDGRPIHDALCARDSRLSALGRYIVAWRSGRLDLQARFEDDVVAQHRSCPLYRSACLAFLPAEYYPVDESRLVESPRGAFVRVLKVSLN
jgi:hypothetical protein